MATPNGGSVDHNEIVRACSVAHRRKEEIMSLPGSSITDALAVQCQTLIDEMGHLPSPAEEREMGLVYESGEHLAYN